MKPFTGFHDGRSGFSAVVTSGCSCRIPRSEGTDSFLPQPHVTSWPAWLIPIGTVCPHSHGSKYLSDMETYGDEMTGIGAFSRLRIHTLGTYRIVKKF